MCPVVVRVRRKSIYPRCGFVFVLILRVSMEGTDVTLGRGRRVISFILVFAHYRVPPVVALRLIVLMPICSVSFYRRNA